MTGDAWTDSEKMVNGMLSLRLIGNQSHAVVSLFLLKGVVLIETPAQSETFITCFNLLVDSILLVVTTL